MKVKTAVLASDIHRCTLDDCPAGILPNAESAKERRLLDEIEVLALREFIYPADWPRVST
jgi:hypothetical protein